MKRPKIVQAITSALSKVAQTAEVILYGSEARGEAKEYSERTLLVDYRIQRAKETLSEMFSLHFIANRKMDRQLSTFYGRLLNDRISGDYDDFVNYDNEMIAALRPQAEEFISVIEKEMKSKNWFAYGIK